MNAQPVDYPNRPKYFACKFVRRMGKVCLANDIGVDACWLLTFIAATEDAKRYRSPVSFWNEDLATRTGLSLSGMKRARDKAVEAGWLNYQAGVKGRAAKYFVLVPPWADEMDDSAGDEEPGELSVLIPVHGEPESIPESNQKTIAGGIVGHIEPESELETLPESTQKHGNNPFVGQVEPECGGESGRNPGHILPFPKPKEEDPPNPPQAGGMSGKKSGRKSRSKDVATTAVVFPAELDTPEFRELWESWSQHRREIRKALTPTSITSQMKILAKWGLARAMVAIEHTIAKGWQGIREPDEVAKPSGRTATQPTMKCRPLSKFESQHVWFNPATGAERDANGNLILDRLCRDLTCAHCKPKRKETA